MTLKLKTKPLILDGNNLTLDAAHKIAGGADLRISLSAKKSVKQSYDCVNRLIKNNIPVYGVNTGFGALANKQIKPDDLHKLQINLLRSHAAGYGNPLTIPETRLAMTLRLNVLLKGNAGVSPDLCEALHRLIHKNIYPLIPEYGSVGASGDLAPLAHLALPLIGEGQVFYRGRQMAAREALKAAGIKPYVLQRKEGLALINGTQIMLSLGVLSFLKANTLQEYADKICALSYEALAASPLSLSPLIHKARHQKGQMLCAARIAKELKGSYLYGKNLSRPRLQDPYSLRCAPQIHGASFDASEYTASILERELNASTDNPLVFAEENSILNGGNFHGQPLAMAMDILSMALAEIGNVSERRLELLLNPNLSGLPAFLTPDPGINSGYMAAQYLSASLVNENKLLANPSCTDSIPGNVGIEDHVSMGMTSARKLKKIVTNLEVILAVEMLAAAQAIDLRNVPKLGHGTQMTYNAVRKDIPMLRTDRIISEDISKAVKILTHKYEF